MHQTKKDLRPNTGNVDRVIERAAVRVARLGGTALGTTQVVARSTTLPP
jgi:hypothetical protein